MARAFADDAVIIGNEIQRVVVTSPKTIQLSILGLLAEGHILLEDVPGVGKTLLGKTLSGAIDCDFKRIQFTPDLLPTDITGTTVFDMKSSIFNFVPGSIFSNRGGSGCLDSVPGFISGITASCFRPPRVSAALCCRTGSGSFCRGSNGVFPHCRTRSIARVQPWLPKPIHTPSGKPPRI